MRNILLAASLVLSLVACDDDESAAVDAAVGEGGEGGEGGVGGEGGHAQGGEGGEGGHAHGGAGGEGGGGHSEGCQTACTRLADCAADEAYCPEIDADSRGGFYEGCLENCAANHGLATAVNGIAGGCEAVVPIVTGASESFRRACEGAEVPMDALDITGDYLDGYGGSHWIDNDVWIQTMAGSLLAFDIEVVDNGGQFAIGHNDAANAFSPDLYSRFDWVVVDDALFYCQTAYDAESVAAAAAVARADDSDPANSGCGGAFPWTSMASGVSIAGRFTDSFGTAHWISTGRWIQGEGAEASIFWVQSYDEAEQVIIAQNDANNAFSPSLFSRFDFVWHEDALFFCQSSFDAQSAEAALAVARGDDADPTVGGCGGTFPWSGLIYQ
jgi:hypothetical protein